MSENSITYSEKRSINTGDFENISSSLSVTTVMNDNIVRINHSESLSANEITQKTVDGLIKRVRHFLDREETKIRKWSDKFVTFETLDKLPKNRKW